MRSLLPVLNATILAVTETSAPGPEGFAVKDVPPECRILVPRFPNRLNGKDTIYRYDAWASGAGGLIMAEMANEKIQVYGNVAIPAKPLIAGCFGNFSEIGRHKVCKNRRNF